MSRFLELTDDSIGKDVFDRQNYYPYVACSTDGSVIYSVEPKNQDYSDLFKLISLEDENIISFNENTWLGSVKNKSGRLYINVNEYEWINLCDITEITVNKGDIVYFRNNGESINKIKATDDLPLFTTTKTFDIEGDLDKFMLAGGTLASTSNVGWYSYYKLFTATNVVDASGLILSSTTLGNYCYMAMFKDCTSLVAAPELPATKLANHCYNSMFTGCTSLVTAPKILPAAELNIYCYANMFSWCASLTSVPEILPATKLAKDCYANMFYNCSSLTTAPELPVATLAESCYDSMFNGCTNLNYIKCLATDISAIDCTKNFTKNVAATGTFVKHPDMNDWTIGIDGIPVNWNAVDDVDEPETPIDNTFRIISVDDDNIINFRNIDPETNESPWIERIFEKYNDTTMMINHLQFKVDDGEWLPISHYDRYTINSGQTMYFRNTSNIDIDKDIDGTTPLFTTSGYFNLAGDLDAFMIPSGSLQEYSYHGLFAGLKISDASQLILKSTDLKRYCYAYMFDDCRSLMKAPELPATTLADYCYRRMFRNCMHLAESPVLPAVRLKLDAYYEMFYGCLILRKVTCMFNDPTAAPSITTQGWLNGVSPSGTFYKNPNAPEDYWEWSSADPNSSVPEGWEVLDAEI